VQVEGPPPLWRATRRVLVYSSGSLTTARLEVLVWFGIAVFVLGIIIIVVGSRAASSCHDGDDPPSTNQVETSRDASGHFGSCWTS